MTETRGPYRHSSPNTTRWADNVTVGRISGRPVPIPVLLCQALSSL
jgi:hypothetical protein